MKTRRNVYYDLTESPYKYEDHNLTFVFSSNFYLQKFINEKVRYIKEENDKMNTYFGCISDLSIIMMVKLYRKIEKRGFRILLNNHDVSDIYLTTILE